MSKLQLAYKALREGNATPEQIALVERQRERHREYRRERMATDPEYRERERERYRAYYARKKLENKQPENTDV